MEEVIRAYVRNIVDRKITSVWQVLNSNMIRWEFNTFTDYIPFEKKGLNWSQDSEETRRYWNWQPASASEWTRFQGSFLPRLVSLFYELENSDFETLIEALPLIIFIRKYTKLVNIPVQWEMQTIDQEGYARWIGFYDKKVEVARPISFVPHEFYFERIDFDYVLNQLADLDRTREIIQAKKQSRA